MIKKLSSLAGEAGDNQLLDTIRESTNTIWLAGLGAFAKAQEEGGKLFDALVREGEAVQRRTSRTANEAMTEIKDRANTIRESTNNIWLAGLGAFTKAQEEGGRMFDALVKEGEAVQKRTSRSAEEAMTEIKDRASGTWDKLEQVFEDRVARALRSLGVPTKADIDALSKRVAELTAVAEKLSATMEGGKPARKPARKAAPRRVAKKR